MSNIVKLEIQADYDTAEHAGASGFQVISVIGIDEDEQEVDLTTKINQGIIFQSERHVAKLLGYDPDVIHIELV